MIFSLFYPIILGLGPLESATELFLLIIFVSIFKSRIYIYPIQIWLFVNLFLVNIFQFHGIIQNLEMLVAVISLSPMHEILSSYTLEKRRKIFHVYLIIFGLIYIFSYVYSNGRDLAGEIIGIGTYNAHGFFALLLLAFIREVRLSDVLMFSIFMLVVGGRTNLLLAIVAVGLFFVKDKTFLVITMLSASVLILLYYQSDIISYVSSYNQDFASKGAELGPRALLYDCINSKASLKEYIFGVDFKQFFESCFISSVGDRVESSLITLISHIGIGSIILFIYLFFSWTRLNLLWLFILLTIRSVSGEFFFFGVYDYFIFFPALLKSKAYKLCW